MLEVRNRSVLPCLAALWCTVLGVAASQAQDHPLTLERLVQPSGHYHHLGQVVNFALYAFIEFRSLEEMFDHIDRETGRWQFDQAVERREFALRLFHKGLESRLISMTFEKPLEILLTHTAEQIAGAASRVRTSAWPLIYRGRHWQLEAETYRDALLSLRERWKGSLNCWSASPSIPGRALSNWYIIQEGISLFGAPYDSTEHFWQAVKFHPQVRLPDLQQLLARFLSHSWAPWLDRLSADQRLYLQHTYAIEFLRSNLAVERLKWFQEEIEKLSRTPSLTVRALQQRQSGTLHFTALQEKVLWGDLADSFHLIHFFLSLEEGRFQTPELKPVLEDLRRHHFDGIYLDGYGSGKMGFISLEFQQLMLEIWKVKFLQMERFRDVLRSTQGLRLLHFLNDGDSPDIPIPVYEGFLRQIRDLALQ